MAKTQITQRIHAAIDENPYCDNDKLQCEVHEGHLVLKGTVSSFFHKQMAQEAIRHIDGVQRIDNQLTVSY